MTPISFLSTPGWLRAMIFLSNSIHDAKFCNIFDWDYNWFGHTVGIISALAWDNCFEEHSPRAFPLSVVTAHCKKWGVMVHTFSTVFWDTFIYVGVT